MASIKILSLAIRVSLEPFTSHTTGLELTSLDARQAHREPDKAAGDSVSYLDLYGIGTDLAPPTFSPPACISPRHETFRNLCINLAQVSQNEPGPADDLSERTALKLECG